MSTQNVAIVLFATMCYKYLYIGFESKATQFSPQLCCRSLASCQAVSIRSCTTPQNTAWLQPEGPVHAPLTAVPPRLRLPCVKLLLALVLRSRCLVPKRAAEMCSRCYSKSQRYCTSTLFVHTSAQYFRIRSLQARVQTSLMGALGVREHQLYGPV